MPPHDRSSAAENVADERIEAVFSAVQACQCLCGLIEEAQHEAALFHSIYAGTPRNIMERYQLRRDRLRKLLRKAGVDRLLVTNFTNVTYLTGFTGDDSYLLVSPDRRGDS